MDSTQTQQQGSITETWVPVLGYEGIYEVSDSGKVRRTGKVDSLTGVPITLQGYLSVSLSKSGKRRTAYVHVIVAEAFQGPRPHGLVCRHLNGNPVDNRPENLAWGTHQESVNDTLRHGKYSNGRDRQVSCIRGHWLGGGNLGLNGKERYRRCLACTYERERSAKAGEPFNIEIADRKFDERMGWLPKSVRKYGKEL